jgi:hypothetical protein
MVVFFIVKNPIEQNDVSTFGIKGLILAAMVCNPFIGLSPILPRSAAGQIIGTPGWFDWNIESRLLAAIINERRAPHAIGFFFCPSREAANDGIKIGIRLHDIPVIEFGGFRFRRIGQKIVMAHFILPLHNNPLGKFMFGIPLPPL